MIVKIFDGNNQLQRDGIWVDIIHIVILTKHTSFQWLIFFVNTILSTYKKNHEWEKRQRFMKGAYIKFENKIMQIVFS